MRRYPLPIMVALCLAAGALTAAPCSEPSGHVLWTIARGDGGTAATADRLTLTLQPVTALAGCELHVRAPDGVSVAPVPATGSDPTSLPPLGPDGALVLGDLHRGLVVPVSFAVTVPPGRGGIVVFTLTASLPGGGTVEEPFAWTVGTPGARPQRRFGAAEFRAVLLPETAKP